MDQKADKLRVMIDKYSFQEPMVEIGCGDGQLLEVINGCGVNCSGVECGSDTIARCKEKGFIVHEDLKGSYNTFFMFYFLEHIPEPATFMRHVYDHLYVGGKGYIEVPNYDYIEKNGIWLEFTIDHVMYYRKRTLSYLLTSCGFTVEHMYGENDLCLTAIVSKGAEDHGFSNMKDKINSDLLSFKSLVDSFDGDFCVYGAGHYSQVILK